MSSPTPEDESRDELKDEFKDELQDKSKQPSADPAPNVADALDTKGPLDGSVPEEVDEYAAERGGYGVSLETG
jgi:hypothetical protein